MEPENITPEEFANLFDDLTIEEFEQVVNERGTEFLEAVEVYLPTEKQEKYQRRLQRVLDRKDGEIRGLRHAISEVDE